MCIRDRASHENQNALPVAKLGLGNPALAPHRRLIDSTINRAGLRNLDGWERQLNLVTASQDDKAYLCRERTEMTFELMPVPRTGRGDNLQARSLRRSGATRTAARTVPSPANFHLQERE